jgi:hypothetical protein
MGFFKKVGQSIGKNPLAAIATIGTAVFAPELLGALGAGGAEAIGASTILPGTVLANGATVLADGSIMAADGSMIAGAGSAAVTGGAAAGAAAGAASPLANINLMPSNESLLQAGVKTGVGLLQGQDPTKAIESGALNLAGGVIGNNVSNAIAPTISDTVGSGTTANALTKGIGSAAGALATGASPESAAISGISSGIGSAVNSEVGPNTAKLASTLTGALLKNATGSTPTNTSNTTNAANTTNNTTTNNTTTTNSGLDATTLLAALSAMSGAGGQASEPVNPVVNIGKQYDLSKMFNTNPLSPNTGASNTMASGGFTNDLLSILNSKG